MKRLIFAALLCLLLQIAASPVAASEFMDMDICMGKQVLARALCKDPMEVNYVSKVRDNIYLFSVFYARQEARFLVGVSNDLIRIQGKEFLTLTKTIPYDFDATAKCGVVEFSVPDCPTSERIVCCSEKTVEEKLDEKFWDRPIPDLLEEDLRKALEVQPPAEEGGSPEGTAGQ